MMTWELKHPKATLDMLGFIPMFLDERDPRSAREQLHANYVGGWEHFKGFELLEDGNLQYPKDPPTLLLAETKLRDEVIRFYQFAWVLVLQPDGTWEVCRMD